MDKFQATDGIVSTLLTCVSYWDSAALKALFNGSCNFREKRASYISNQEGLKLCSKQEIYDSGVKIEPL